MHVIRRDGECDGSDGHCYRIEAVMHGGRRDGDGDGNCYRIETCNACDRRDGEW